MTSFASDLLGSTSASLIARIQRRDPDAYPDWIDDEEEPVTSTERHSLLQRTLAVIRVDFDDVTWQAFWRLAVDNHATADIAADLGVSQGAVRQAKYRVLCRLREEMGG